MYYVIELHIIELNYRTFQNTSRLPLNDDNILSSFNETQIWNEHINLHASYIHDMQKEERK